MHIKEVGVEIAEQNHITLSFRTSSSDHLSSVSTKFVCYIQSIVHRMCLLKQAVACIVEKL